MNRHKITKELRSRLLRSNIPFNKLSRLAGFNIKNVYYKNSSISKEHLKKLSKIIDLTNLRLINFEFDYSKNLGKYSFTQQIQPLVKFNKLSELVGIMLGEGNIYKNSVTISFDKRNKSYIRYVFALCKYLTCINFKSKEALNPNSGYLYCYNRI